MAPSPGVWQVVLGPVGRNVAAGMTGGLGFFLDESGDFCDRVRARVMLPGRSRAHALSS